MPFATTDELADWLGYTITETARATLMLEVATGTIQSWTRQTIEQVANDSVELQGTWEPVLKLPERPVTSVSSVTLDGTLLTVTDDYVVVKDELRRPNAEYHNWQAPSSDFYPFTKTGWGGPSAIVAVTYTHGFATIPDGVKGVCLSLAGRMFTNPEMAATRVVDAQTFQYGQRHLDLTDGEKKVLRKYRRTAKASSQW